jgi:hypothetical protein
MWQSGAEDCSWHMITALLKLSTARFLQSRYQGACVFVLVLLLTSCSASVGLDNSTVRVKSVAAQGSTVVFGTDWALWVSNDAMQSFYFERVPGVIDLGGCNALAFDKDSLWCGTAECVSSRDRTDFSLKRICGNQGLCASNITSIQVVKTGLIGEAKEFFPSLMFA